MPDRGLTDDMFRRIAIDLHNAVGLYLDMIDRGDPRDIRSAISALRTKHAALDGFMEGAGIAPRRKSA